METIVGSGLVARPAIGTRREGLDWENAMEPEPGPGPNPGAGMDAAGKRDAKQAGRSSWGKEEEEQFMRETGILGFAAIQEGGMWAVEALGVEEEEEGKDISDATSSGIAIFSTFSLEEGTGGNIAFKAVISGEGIMVEVRFRHGE